MGFSRLFLLTFLVSFLSNLLKFSTAQPFNCSSSPTSCHALVGYVTPNSTNLGAIQVLFNVKNFRHLLGANNLSLTTPRSQTVRAQQVIKVPINCVCYNNTGTSNGSPIYVVKPDDTLLHIAAEVFMRLLTYPQIVEANDIKNPNLILVGQRLRIPLPCSCDDVNGEKVVHYAHVVKPKSTLEEIAQQFGTDNNTLARLNGIAGDKELIAEQALDIPLKACNSLVRTESRDYPLLAANGTYIYTAYNCVRCMCDAANNWTLHCEPFQNHSNRTCPSMQCDDGSFLGSSTTSSGCKVTCSYAGYINNSSIFTTLVGDSNCTSSSPSNDGSRIKLKNWGFLSILVLFSLPLFQ